MQRKNEMEGPSTLDISSEGRINKSFNKYNSLVSHWTTPGTGSRCYTGVRNFIVAVDYGSVLRYFPASTAKSNIGTESWRVSAALVEKLGSVDLALVTHTTSATSVGMPIFILAAFLTLKPASG